MKRFSKLLPLILLIILIFAGCKGVIPPKPVTDDTAITGRIKMPSPCCSISGTDKGEPSGHYTDNWPLIPNAVVELHSVGQCDKLIQSTISEDDGSYQFTNVTPGLYIITAYCPVKGDFFFKDVVGKIAHEDIDAGIPDSESTSSAMVIEIIKDCYRDFEHVSCFKEGSEIYRTAKGIADDIGVVDIVQIEGHKNYRSLVNKVRERQVGCCLPEPAPKPKYTVTYDGNGSETGNNPTDIKSPYIVGEKVTVLGPGDIKKTGYNFTGWNTKADGSGTSYIEGATFEMPSNNVVLYAKWAINKYTISTSADPEAGGTTSGGGSVDHGVQVTVVATANSGYSFVNWTEDSTEVSKQRGQVLNYQFLRTKVFRFLCFVKYIFSHYLLSL